MRQQTLDTGTLAAATVIETHVSRVFLSGDLAFKLKKPVHNGFLDFSTVERREQACRREVDLNRRLAPDVYLGVAHVDLGSVSEPVVVMRRMPDEHCLAALAVSGADLTVPVTEIAALLARFHGGAPRSRSISAAATPAGVRTRWTQNMQQLRAFLLPGLDVEQVHEIDARGLRFLEGRSRLLRARAADGRSCDGHGDLLASDIYCPPGLPPQILDCLEFDSALRYGDVLGDVAFLAMDLERLGRASEARLLLATYAAEAEDAWPDSLASFYIAHRAVIRAKVACLRRSSDADAERDAQAHLELADRHTRTALVRLVLVGGAPGTGKTTLASRLGRLGGWTVLSSDVVRKSEAGITSTADASAPFDRGIYERRRTAATYRSLLRTAGDLLSMGRGVVLDATWSSAVRRNWARQLAKACAADLVELEARVPTELAAQRLHDRQRTCTSASDADVDVAERIRASTDPWPSATPVDMSGDAGQVAARVYSAILAAQ